MARPIKEGMDYFPHDVNAHTDKKIEALRALYGNNGYAFYFIMLEQIYQEPTFELDVSDAETREETFQILSRKVSVTLEEFKQILNTSLKWGCFDKDLYTTQGIITSNGIKKRASVVIEKRDKMRKKYHQEKRIVSDAETPPEMGEETPQSKVKKSKEKKSNIYTSEFETWYLSWPRQQSKQDSFKNFEKRRKEHGLDFILQCSENYLGYLRLLPSDKQEFAYSSNNFFGQKAYYLDFQEPKPIQRNNQSSALCDSNGIPF